MTRPTSAVFLILAALAPAIAGCQKGAAAKTNAATPAAVATPYAAVADGKADVEGGIIQVAARTQGIVREVDVVEGDPVKKGQVLARLEDDAPRLAAATAAANLNQARAQTDLTQTQQASAVREYDRLKPLMAQRFVSGQAVDQAQDAVRNAGASLTAEHAAIGVAQTQLAQAQYQLELTVIRAPADGRIVRRYANPGVGASSLNVTPMFDLEPNGARIVRAEVSESAQPFVSVGQNVQLLAEADQSKTYPGKVLRIAPVYGARKLASDDPSERTDERVVEVVVSADGAPFLIGQRVLVKFLKK
jgi:RND family efflux transporter MFP subunit